MNKFAVIGLCAIGAGIAGIWYSLEATERPACYSTPGPNGPFREVIDDNVCANMVGTISTSDLSSLTTTHNGNLIVSTGGKLSPETPGRFADHLRSVKMNSRKKGRGSKVLLAASIALAFFGCGLVLYGRTRPRA